MYAVCTGNSNIFKGLCGGGEEWSARRIKAKREKEGAGGRERRRG